MVSVRDLTESPLHVERRQDHEITCMDQTDRENRLLRQRWRQHARNA